jgi:hypothetical protein
MFFTNEQAFFFAISFGTFASFAQLGIIMTRSLLLLIGDFVSGLSLRC